LVFDDRVVGQGPIDQILVAIRIVDHDPDPRFLDADHNPVPKNYLKDSLFTVAIPTDNQE